LFAFYDGIHPIPPPVIIGALTWDYVSGLSGHNAGDAWNDGTYDYIQLGAADGVRALAGVPEPGTLALLAAGLAGLLCYAWRKRR
jgi:hypothetical protein